MKNNKFLYIIFFMALAFSNILLNKKFYSQGKQDQFLYEKFFKNMKLPGTFVEVGAYDGKTYSNTLFLEKELNWRGICIEPIPAIYDQLVRNRTCICVQGCIGRTNGFRSFLQIDGAPQMLSGLMDAYDPRHLERIKLELQRDGGSAHEITVQTYNLTDLLRSNNMNQVTYLSLDTEGNELEILQSIDFNQTYIAIISVENNYNEPKIKNFLQTKNYIYITRIDGDEIYCHKTFTTLV